MKKVLEICCADIDSVVAAIQGGANRIELCSALELGGLTPSYGLIRRTMSIIALSRSKARVNVLIRPRPGDFCYSKLDELVMSDDIDMAADLGAHGVALGALTPEGEVDEDLAAELINRAGDLKVTFHRAFDICANPEEALEQVISLGCDHLLTSGCAPTARQGVAMLKKLNEQAAGRIRLIAASGVNPHNALQILAETGLNEIHASASAEIEPKYQSGGEVKMGGGESPRRSTSKKIVEEIHAEISRLK